jgi:hypothetical protein
LLCAGSYGCARLAAGPAGGVCRRALATGLALGLVPLAKLQGAPAGLVLAAVAWVCLVARFRGRGRKQWAAGLALGAGGLAPAALAALYLWSQGLFAHFWASYVGVNLALANERGLGMYGKVRSFLEWAPEMPLNELFFPYFLFTIGAGLLLMGLVRRGGRCWRLLLAGGAVLLASLYGVITPGFPFGHYLLFLLFPLAFQAAVVLATLYETPRGRAGRLALVAVCLGSAVAVPAAKALRRGNPWLGTEPDRTDGIAELIRAYASPREKLVVWGWMDRYYVLTGLRPATLHPNTYWEILSAEDSSLSDYFYRLFLQRFDQAKPPVFVDAVGPVSFYFRDPDRFAHESFPELRERIVARYVLVGEADGARVYVSKERLAELPSAREAPPPRRAQRRVPDGMERRCR